MIQLPFAATVIRAATVTLLILTSNCLVVGQEEPVILSTVPAFGASGVSPTAAVVFVFSEAMDNTQTTVDFLDGTTFETLPIASVWSAGNTKLTCTPDPAFPANRMIFWSADGVSDLGDPLGGNTGGFFTTGGAGGGGGSGTNRFTELAVGRVNFYTQVSTAAPTLDPDLTYAFTANATIASNRVATAVSLAIPGGAISNLTQSPVRAEQFFMFADNTNLASLEATFPSGNYVFNLVSNAAVQSVTVTLPASLSQPAAPHVNNYPQAQAVNAAQPFTLRWDAFPGGTASDYISVSVGSAFRTPDPLTAGALNGTATSVQIPAGALQAGTPYEANIGFYRAVFTSNATFTTTAYRAAETRFSLITVGTGSGQPPILVNPLWDNDSFSFDVISTSGQSLSIEYNPSAVAVGWKPLLTTNSGATGLIRIVDTPGPGAASRMYRARNGP